MGPQAPDYAVDRRPLATRQTALARRLAGWLACRRVAPNAISLAGLAFGMAAGVLLATTGIATPLGRRVLFLLAAGSIQLRLACNLLDGMVAVEHGRASRLGELFNDVPDRVSDAATLIGAGYAAGGQPVLGYLAACVAIFTAYVRAIGKAAGGPQEFCGPMAKQQRMFLLTVISVYCGLAPTAWQPFWRRPGYGIMSAALLLIVLGGLVTAARRLVRISSSLRHLPL